MKTTIIMPAYNEEKMIGRVLDSLCNEGYDDIIVVNDGSKDRTAKIAKSKGADVYSHAVNRGLGGALGTGFHIAIQRDSDIIVTFDSDGQHDPQDVKKIITPIAQNRADVVIGSRLIRPRGMPVLRRVGNLGLNVITYALFGVWTTDSQSGLRAFSKHAAKRIDIKSNKMEVSSEIIKEIGAKRLRFAEVPIKPIYTNYSMEHGQSNMNGFRIVAKLVLKRLMK